jgi:hypothetical protein
MIRRRRWLVLTSCLATAGTVLACTPVTIKAQELRGGSRDSPVWEIDWFSLIPERSESLPALQIEQRIGNESSLPLHQVIGVASAVTTSRPATPGSWAATGAVRPSAASTSTASSARARGTGRVVML